MLTQKWTLAWWVCTAVLVVVGVTLQVWLTMSERPPSRRQHAEDIKSRSLKQKMGGAGEQSAKRAEVSGDFVQEQDS